MNPQTERKIILVVRETRLNELVRRYNTVEQARFHLQHFGADFDDLVAEDHTYVAARRAVESMLKRWGRVQVLQRDFLPNFVFGPDELIVVLGPDGLVANTLKYLNGHALIGVNPDPDRWDGQLLPFNVADLSALLPEAMTGKRPVKQVTMARAALADGQVLYGVNDLFIGRRTHVSARYDIRLGNRRESQSSSGIIVSTGLGSTGWLTSVLTGAAGIASALAQRPFRIDQRRSFAWDAAYVYFSVREPFPSRTTGTDLVFGKIRQGEDLCVVSNMSEEGVIFSDGVESDYLQFASGMTARIGVADKHGRLVV